MEVDTPTKPDRDVKAEDDSGDTRMGEDKPTYRSWKKKYRKMRFVFDQKMREGEELYKLEQKAMATARRLAVEKDRLLDMLLDINNSPRIPLDKRINLALEVPSDKDALSLDVDRDLRPGDKPTKNYKDLLSDVPHITFDKAAEQFPQSYADLIAGHDKSADLTSTNKRHPPSFLTADDIDNYIWEIDTRLAAKNETAAALLPSLAPNARDAAAHSGDGGSAARDFALRNPTSVYNWLRKHAPKTFLQDGEGHGDSAKDKDKDKDAAEDHTPRRKTERGAGGGRRESGMRGKRGSAAHTREKHAANADTVEAADDDAAHKSEGGKGKRKRIVDDDPGYRPKGGSSRPTKKKRKSEGAEERTPSGPKKRKSLGVDTPSAKDGGD